VERFFALLFSLALTVAVRGGSPPAFDGRCIPAGCVAPSSNIPDILGRRALPSGRLARLDATPDFRHGLLGGYAAHAAGDVKAEELLKQARASLGGEAKLSKVQGLSCAGTVQRAIGDRQVTGDITIDLQLPDKLLRSDSISPMGDAALVVTEQGINGDQLLRHSKTLNTPPGAVIRVPLAPAHGSDGETQGLRNSRADLARLMLAMLVAAPASVPLEFKYAGEAESPDGKADVIDVTGPSSFAAKLFLDKTHHRPLMLAYRGVAPRVVMQMQRGGPPPAAATQAGPSPAAQDQVDITMFLDDYKAVEGVMLPHHITRSVDGQPHEEMVFTTIKVNPVFKADTFSPK